MSRLAAEQPSEEPDPRHEKAASYSDRGQVTSVDRLEGERATDPEVPGSLVDCQYVWQLVDVHAATSL
jgi:hypothetical protein